MAEHLIELPLTLIEQWRSEPEIVKVEQIGLRPTLISMSEKRFQELMNKAAQWGADTELGACVEWLRTKEWIHPEFSDELRADRRPKPPSLQDLALNDLEQIATLLMKNNLPCNTGNIRRALKNQDG